MFKKCRILSVFAFIALAFAFSSSLPVYAENTTSTDGGASSSESGSNETWSGNTNTNATEGDCQTVLGLRPWYCHVELEDPTNEEGLSAIIFTIVSNLITDALILGAYLAVGFVIWGGYQYMFSSGDPGRAIKGRNTISMSLIGLGITLLAYVIVGTVTVAVGGHQGTVTIDPDSGEISSTVTGPSTADDIASFFSWAVGVAGVVCAIFVVMGGISYITSAGDQQKLGKAKLTIRNALIGLAVVAFAEIIVGVTRTVIRNNLSFSPNESEVALVSQENNSKKELYS